jgi:hypothetical protein
MRRLQQIWRQSQIPGGVQPPSVASLTPAHLRTMSTDDLVKLLMSPELAQPANAPVREQVITLLQEREGNDFVRRVLGLPPGEEVT